MRAALFCLTIALAPFATSTTAFAQRNSASATFDISVGMIHRGGEIYVASKAASILHFCHTSASSQRRGVPRFRPFGMGRCRWLRARWSSA